MNLRIYFLAVAFSLVETGYFGWHMLPASSAELICDGITLTLFAMSIKRRR